MNYFIEFAKDRDTQEEFRYRFVLTLKQPLNKITPIKLNSLMGLDGVDDIKVVGKYSFDVLLARTFDIEKVIEDIKSLADSIQNTETIMLDKEIKT